MTTARPRGATVLVIEDTSSLQMIYSAALAKAGYQVRIAATAAAGLALFRETVPEVVLLDLQLPDRDGLSLMRDLMVLRPDVAVVVVTANGSVNVAVEAMRGGAQDFLVKPVEEARLLQAVAAARRRQAVPAGRAADRVVPEAAVWGTSAAMQALQARIAAVARSMATVFITGESGTGKDLAALAVHAGSPRAGGAFVALNCAAIPPDQLDAELFGLLDRPGAVQAADGGTLFLDDICDMPAAVQSRLLRLLQTSTVPTTGAAGAARPRKVDVRIICASTRDPAECVRHGQFREDLFYRLYVVPLHIPPLRDRGEDAVQIAGAALARFGAEEGKLFDGLAPDTLALIRRHPWPGNVRQLLNAVRHVAVLHDGGTVTPAMLPPDLTRAAPPPPDAPPAADDLAGLTLAQVERRVIAAALARHQGSVPAAARALDVAPSTLYRKLEAWGRA